MKQLLTLFTCLSLSLSAQTSLTQAIHEPKPGDLETLYGLDTSAFTSGMPNIAGNGVTWDFKKLKAVQPSFDNYYLSASSVTNAANYPGCNLVQESNGVYSFYKSTTTPTTQTELLGVETSTISVKFTNSGIIAVFPVNYGSTVTDNLSGTFTFSITGTCSGNIVTTADGIGTLNLPEGVSFPNVLRVKSVQTITLTAGFFPAGTMKQTIYNYYRGNEKFPVLSINYSRITSTFLQNPITTAFATGSFNHFVTGIEEDQKHMISAVLYPNPAHSTVNIGLDASAGFEKAELYNQLGQLVLSSHQSDNIDVSGLEKGIYSVEVTTGKGVSRHKLLKF